MITQGYGLRGGGRIPRAAPRAPHPGVLPIFFRIFVGVFSFPEKAKAPTRGTTRNNSLSLYHKKKGNMNVITVDELYKALAQARKAGMGSKKIMLSNDDEGNGYHQCFFSVTSDMESFGFDEAWAAGMLPYSVSPEEAVKDYVIIG